MKLNRVTITGADDAVDPAALIELSAEYPFVEWGILRSRKLNDSAKDFVGAIRYPGAVRYPSPKWRDALGFAIRQSTTAVQLAAHLCGELSREAMAGLQTWHYECALTYRRIQLNGFSRYRLPMLAVSRCFSDLEFILQVTNHEALTHAQELAVQHPNVVALWDQSGGEGRSITEFPTPPLRMGYAGGINPGNLLQVLRDCPAAEAWLDMESGVRTDDRFDLVKVRQVLEIAKWYMVSDGGGRS